MAISIDPSNVYKIFRDKGHREKEEIIWFLDEMAEEAEILYSIWEKLCRIASKNGEMTDAEYDELKYNRLFNCNGNVYGRLKYFYENMSQSIGGKLEAEWLEKIFDHLAKVIRSRDHIKVVMDEFTDKKLSKFYINNENESIDITDLATSLKVLQREVAAIKTLPKIMKLAKIK